MELIEQIKDDIKNNSIVLYMKGTKEMPMCGFSSTVVKVLNMHNVNYKDKSCILFEDDERMNVEKEEEDYDDKLVQRIAEGVIVVNAEAR